MNATSSLDFFLQEQLKRNRYPSLKDGNLTFYNKRDFNNHERDSSEYDKEFNQCNFNLYRTQNDKGFKNNTRYQIRNSRNHPRLKIIDTSQKKRQFFSENSHSQVKSSHLPLQKIYNYSQLKSMMSKEVEKFSLPKKYQSFLQKFSGSEFAGELGSELAFVPNNLPKFSQKRKSQHKKKISESFSHGEQKITILGNKIRKNFPKIELSQEQLRSQSRNDAIDSGSKNDRKRRMSKFSNRKYISPYRMNRQDINIGGEQESNQEQFQPLTGWADHDNNL